MQTQTAAATTAKSGYYRKPAKPAKVSKQGGRPKKATAASTPPQPLEQYINFHNVTEALHWSAEHSYHNLKLRGRQVFTCAPPVSLRRLDERFCPEDRVKLSQSVMKVVSQLPDLYKKLLLYTALGDRASPEWEQTVEAIRRDARSKGQRIPQMFKYSPAVISMYSGIPAWQVEAEIKNAYAELAERLQQAKLL